LTYRIAVTLFVNTYGPVEEVDFPLPMDITVVNMQITRINRQNDQHHGNEQAECQDKVTTARQDASVPNAELHDHHTDSDATGDNSTYELHNIDTDDNVNST